MQVLLKVVAECKYHDVALDITDVVEAIKRSTKCIPVDAHYDAQRSSAYITAQYETEHKNKHYYGNNIAIKSDIPGLTGNEIALVKALDEIEVLFNVVRKEREHLMPTCATRV